MERENQEKAFKKYATFVRITYIIKQYWNRREREKERKKHFKILKDKLAEKAEILEALEKANEKKKKQIVERLNAMTKKKEQYEKEKVEKFERDMQKRKELYDLCQENKEHLIQEQNERREDILALESTFFNRSLNKDNLTNMKRINAG